MENVNCKKLFLGALLVAFGSTQVVGQMPTYSQAQTNSYVPVSLPESVTIGGPIVDASHIQVQQYPSAQVLSGLSGSVNGYAAPVLNTISNYIQNPDGSIGTQVSGVVYQPVNGVQNIVGDQHVVSSPQVLPVNYQLGYQTVQQVQPVLQAPVQPVQQVVPVFGSQVVPNQTTGYQYLDTGVPANLRSYV